jgi:hypothetical protein
VFTESPSVRAVVSASVSLGDREAEILTGFTTFGAGLGETG